MKTILNILSGLFLLMISCNSRSTTTRDRKYYIESKPSFFELRHGDWLTNKWIRKPENLLAIHETFKKFGYTKLIPNRLLYESPFIIQNIYINQSGGQLLDSLEITYNQTDIKGKYFREFWQRRKAEKNDSIVYVIIKDINFTIKTGLTSHKANSALVNDTLMQLLKIDYKTDDLTEQLARQDFEALRQLGFHQSAYNILFETYRYQDLKWNRDSLEKTLKQSDKFTYPWFQDETK